MSRVWDSADCESTELIVLLAMADFARDNGDCWPSLSTLASKARISVRQVRRIIRTLEEKGYVRTEERPGTSNFYAINLEALTEPPKKVDSREMFKALAQTCSINLNTLTGKQRGILNQTEKVLREAGATPDGVLQFRRWWDQYDWRGQKGQAPMPHQVREEWGAYKEDLAASENPFRRR